jgi:ABC-type Fe3+-hydroxamate transport system substrate-binding protein
LGLLNCASYHFKSTKKVGGTKKVHYEKIRLLEPDLIICNKEENTQRLLRSCEICPVWVTNIITIEDTSRWYLTLVNFKLPDRSPKWNNKLAFAWAILKFHEDIPVKTVAYFIWKILIWSGSDNFINELLKLNHFKNIYDK